MSAAILILITLSQLMLTRSASILTEIINDVTLLKNELNTFMAQDGNKTEMSASGEFVRPPKLVDTTIIKTKLHELQNNVTKLAEAILNKNQNVDDIKNGISTMQKEIEDIRKMYDNKDQEITQTLVKFQNIISDLLAKYKNREKELAKLQYEEFLEAIKHKYYQFAAVKIGTMKNVTSARNLVHTVYKEIGDLPPMLEFADNVNNLEMKLLIYETIINSNTFRHCLVCNVLLYCNKYREVLENNVFTGELRKRFSDTYFLYHIHVVRFTGVGYCGRYSMKKEPALVKYLVENYCLSGKQRGYESAIHDYSGYCYPIDSIYSIFE
uniref:Uncharacterized protein n=1 Tax=Rhodnius prolixus TaxID=13249 RepID=A0A4P6DFT5_RHOPR